MNNVLLTVGAACVVLAIVGTGGKVLGVELPVIRKQRGWRLGALAVVGCIFLAGAYLTREQPGGASAPEPPEVTAYRQAAATACASLVSASNGDALAPADNDDGTFNRDRFQAALYSQLKGDTAVMDQLWQQPVPGELTRDAQAAHASSDRYLADLKAEFDSMPGKLPATVSLQQVAAWVDGLAASISGPGTQLQTALGRLSGRPCTLSPQPSGA